MAHIYIRNQNQQYVFELPMVVGTEVYIGTEATCPSNLAGAGGVSPVHARIVCQPEGYVIEDLKSQYGTLVGGRPVVQPEYMMPGVEYVLGEAVLILDLSTQQVVSPEPVAQQQPQQEAGKPKLRAAVPKRTAGGAAAIKGSVLMTATAAAYKRSSGGSALTVICVFVILAIAFYTGLALHHWERTGNFLPGIVADPEPEEE